MVDVAEQVAWIEPEPTFVLPGFAIVVPGVPIPQGSLRAFTRNGKAWASSDNPRTRPWKAAVTAEAARVVEEQALETPAFGRGPVAVDVTFLLPRPKGHYGTRGLLPSAPTVPTVTPDLDKLVRAVLDALTGIVWRDDAQVASLIAGKRYVEDHQPLATTIRVAAIEALR